MHHERKEQRGRGMSWAGMLHMAVAKQTLAFNLLIKLINALNMLIKYTTGYPSGRPQAQTDNCPNLAGCCLTNNALSAKLNLLTSTVKQLQ